MAEQFTGDFRTVGTVDGSQPVTAIFEVKSGAAATIAAGDLVVVDGSNPGYVAKGANGAADSATWVGRATKASTETAAADGTVEVEFAKAGLIVRGQAHTPANLAQAIKLTKVTLEVDGGGNQKIDENDTTNGILTVWAFDADEETIDVVVPCTLVA